MGDFFVEEIEYNKIIEEKEAFIRKVSSEVLKLKGTPLDIATIKKNPIKQEEDSFFKILGI